MVVYETDLPRVGKKFDLDLDRNAKLVVVVHNTGKRELFLQESSDCDPKKLFEASEETANQLGTIMEGTYFQSVRDETISTVLDRDALLEWVRVAETSALVDETIAESGLLETDASIIAIQRGSETIRNPDPETTLRGGDTLVAIGDRRSHTALEAIASGEAADRSDRGES